MMHSDAIPAFIHRPITRRKLVASLGIGAAAVLLAACSVDNTAQNTPAPTAAAAPTKAAVPTTAEAPTTLGTAATSTTGGAASPVAAGATVAPAATGAAQTSNQSIKGMSLAFIGGSYFIPEAQTLFQNQMKQWGQDNGVNVSSDFLNWPDLQAKIAASVQSGGGGDMFELWPGWTFLYPDNLADVSDVANAVGEKQGGFYDSWVTPAVQVNGKWLGVPTGNTNVAVNYRISYLKQAGVADPEHKFIDTWEELFAVGKKLKDAGKPIGQALGHSTGDPQAFCYPYMWSYGAMEVDKDGKTVAFNKPEFVDAMKRFVQAWKDGYDTAALAGDDSYNNRAFLADQIGLTLNGTSIYAAALKQSTDIAKDMSHADIPQGPAGRFYNFGSHSYAVLKASKSLPAAKAFLSWWFDPKQFGDWIHIQSTYQIPPTKMWESDPMWDADPKFAAVKNDTKYGRLIGYAGPPNQKAALASSKYIVVDTFSKAVLSGDANAAIQSGADQLKQIYGG